MATIDKVNESSVDELSSLWQIACEDYKNETGIAISGEGFPKLSGPEELSHQLDVEETSFQNFRMKKRPLLRAMQSILAPFENWGDLIGTAASAAFPPASSIMGAMLLLVRGARKVSESFDMIADIFEKLSNFAVRLDVYTDVPLSKGMKLIIVKVLVNFLRVCAVSQKLLKTGSFKARLSKWAKNIIIEDTSVRSLLDELRELTDQEKLMINAQNLNLAHQAVKNTADLLEKRNLKSDQERLDRVKNSLRPVSASNQVRSAIMSSRIPNSGIWVEQKVKSWWQSSQPILWLHGGPAVGKSYLAAKIIDVLTEIEAPHMSAVASFFFKNNDVDLRSINKALRTLAWQVAAQLPSFAEHAEDFCLKADPADTYSVWRNLFLKFFADKGSNVSTFFVIDGIDEADPEEQDMLFSLLEKTCHLEEEQVQSSTPLRFVLLSRDSVRSGLEEHSLEWVPEIEISNHENKKDLDDYVSQKLQKSKLFKNSPDLLKDVVNDIIESAEGLWEWANLVIRSVSQCSTKGQVQRVVKTMPRGINAMLSQELRRLARELSTDMPPADVGELENIKQLNLVISFVSVAKRPLSVKQLDQILEIILMDEVLNLEQQIGTTYSSLLAMRDAGDHKDYSEDDVIVTLRHSSFYEFFRLFNNVETGAIHLDAENAEVVFVSALLHALLNTHTPISNQPLDPVEIYADKFLPHHLTAAKPEKAGILQDKISTCISELFSEDLKRQRFITAHFVFTSSYSLRAWSWLTDLAYYYFDAGDYNTSNERAQHVLKWFRPDAKERFEESARSMVAPNDICPFTILFSPLVVSLSRHWLNPSNIEPSDGRPHSIPTILNIFGEMAGNLEVSAIFRQAGDLVSRPISTVTPPLSASRIMLVARLQKFEMTATWHARLAQALYCRDYYKRSLYHFNKALSMDHKNPALSSVSLSVIHRDMASACFETGKYEEAVHHRRLADNFGGKPMADEFPSTDTYIRHLLEVAQLEYLAKMPEQAFAMADEAWQIYLENEEYRDWFLWMDFLSIFLELKQFHRLRSVFELFLRCFQQLSGQDHEADSLAQTLFKGCTWRLRTLYKAVHFGLTPDDKDCLQLMARAVDGLPQRRFEFAMFKLNLFIGTALSEKGDVATGIRMLYRAVSIPKGDLVFWHSDYARELAIGYLTAVCLYHPETPLSIESPLELDADAEFSDICLVISSWLQKTGDHENARMALRGRVKSCLQLLSDEDPANDGDAWLELFKTLLVDLDSDEDLSGALYMVKTWRRTSSNHDIPESDDDYEDIEAPEDVESVNDSTRHKCPVENEKATESKKEEDAVDDVVWFVEGSRVLRGSGESYTACANCDLQVTSVSDWYFCRSCPHTVLCIACYGEIESDSVKSFLSQHAPQTCNSQHVFYYTGKPLRMSECEELGKIRLTSTDTGDIKTLWIEEWKDKLAEKWGTKDFEFEGGLSAWCMKVLPELQRERWATLFKGITGISSDN